MKNIVLILNSYPQNVKGMKKFENNQVDFFTHDKKSLLNYHRLPLAKYLSFLCFSIVLLYRKWNQTSLLSPEVESTSCLTIGW